eukprot:TRINITY_DN70112_c1_g1_i2.p1 TRINITY_DN70112_c1_g1~~TRINITY_DN70112_c1_g1_i2.p1  ORF type:complete len:110 (-),score=8.46 TRINITY_DN70112_c1_g1_i2:288-617(-)
MSGRWLRKERTKKAKYTELEALLCFVLGFVSFASLQLVGCILSHAVQCSSFVLDAHADALIKVRERDTTLVNNRETYERKYKFACTMWYRGHAVHKHVVMVCNRSCHAI